MRRGDMVTARRSFAHILGQARQTGDRFRIVRCAYQMAELELIEGRDADALAYLAESLALPREQAATARCRSCCAPSAGRWSAWAAMARLRV